jgi:hypothetical protein
MSRSINNMSSVGIFYRASSPDQIFIEMKDDGHPVRAVRRQLSPIGGNWVGREARHDAGPLSTLRREVGEELAFDHPLRDALELAELGHNNEDVQFFAPTKRNDFEVTEEDKEDLEMIRVGITSSAVPYADFLHTISKSVMDAADPKNEREGFSVITSYFTVGFDENLWTKLARLQAKFGNLSNESISMIITLEEIIHSSTYIAFGHDAAMRKFFLDNNCPDAEKLPHVEGVESVYLGEPHTSYDYYLAEFDIAKKP